jgi:hypothetical protein
MIGEKGCQYEDGYSNAFFLHVEVWHRFRRSTTSKVFGILLGKS